MSVSQRLEQRQVQTLTLTPQLREAIRLLELPVSELATYVEQAVQANPLLSLEHHHDLEDPLKELSDDGEFLGEGESPPGVLGSRMTGQGSSSDEEDEGETLIERLPASSETLRDHLLSQLNTDLRDPFEKMIGLRMIDGLDESGYLCLSLEELERDLGCPRSHIEKTLLKVQQFNPAGVFARTLAECLRLQLKDQQKLTPHMDRLLDALPQLLHSTKEKLSRMCGVGVDELSRMIALLQTLDPKPGLRFEKPFFDTLIPDVYVTYQDSTDQWIVRLNQDILPRLAFEKNYHRYLRSLESDNGIAHHYMRQQLHQARWLMKALAQREKTILAVAREIVKEQENFFHQGVMFLKPLTLKDIAQSTGLHESTISRVTIHKYMATPRGVFELKYFFSQGFFSESPGNEGISARTIQHRLNQLVQQENKEKPYSDDELTTILKKEGFPVARRTLAKYREALKIPSSYQRRSHL